MSGWPWPLDGIQSWFEDLWNWISTSAAGAVSIVSSWIWDAINWIWDALQNSFNWVRDRIFDIGGWVRDRIFDMIEGLKSFFGNSINWLRDRLTDVGGWIRDRVFDIIEGLKSFFGNSINWLSDRFSAVGGAIRDGVLNGLAAAKNAISAGVTGLYTFMSEHIGMAVEFIGESVGGAVEAIGSWVSEALSGVANALGEALQGFWDFMTKEIPKALGVVASFVSDKIISPIVSGLGWVFTKLTDIVKSLISQIEGLFRGHSPINPQDAFNLAIPMVVLALGAGALVTGVIDAASTHILGSGLNLRSLGAFMKDLVNPSMFMGAILGVLVAVGIRSPVTQYYRRMFRPEIPDVSTATRMFWRGKLTEAQFKDVVARWGYGDPFEAAYLELTKQIPGTADLVRMVVREAFDPKVVVEAPEVFAEYLTKMGLSKEWADRYWTAHFLPIGLGQAYANLWRGNWTKDQFMFALHIADIHPMWREDIYKVAFRAPGIRELGYGFDTALYSVEDIIMYRRMAGLSPEDAEKAALSLVAYRTEAEREALRREALADYVAGLDTEEDLRSKLGAIGGHPELVNLWVARAQYRTERDLTLDLVKVVTTDFIKGWSSEAEFRQDLIELGVVPERRNVIIREAQARRLSYKREAAAEKNKLLTSTKISKARELGLIGDAEFVRRHVAANYTEDDARLLLSIELTPRPVTAAEIERRRATITSRLNKATRRWETRLAGIQDQIDLTALQLEDAAVTRDEALDVIDAQIAVYDTLIAEATEERVEALEARRIVLLQRRELAEATWADRIRRLTEQHTSLVEKRALMIRHRDEELGEYEEELRLLEVAS